MNNRNKSLYPGCILKQDVNGYWYSGNQVSTYEVVTKLCNKDCSISRETRDGWVDTLYKTVNADPKKYGTYAGLDNWSPVFTDAQLTAFVEQVNQVMVS